MANFVAVRSSVGAVPFQKCVIRTSSGLHCAPALMKIAPHCVFVRVGSNQRKSNYLCHLLALVIFAFVNFDEQQVRMKVAVASA